MEQEASRTQSGVAQCTWTILLQFLEKGEVPFVYRHLPNMDTIHSFSVASVWWIHVDPLMPCFDFRYGFHLTFELHYDGPSYFILKPKQQAGWHVAQGSSPGLLASWSWGWSTCTLRHQRRVARMRSRWIKWFERSGSKQSLTNRPGQIQKVGQLPLFCCVLRSIEFRQVWDFQRKNTPCQRSHLRVQKAHRNCCAAA